MVTYTRNASGTKIVNDGTLFAIIKQNGEKNYSFERPEADPLVEAPFLVEKAADLRVFVTGDLAFYATVLGMENASASACWLCRLKKTEWNADPLRKGKKRTMKWILEHAPAAVEENSTRLHGMKENPLLDTIETCRYIVPPSTQCWVLEMGF